MRQVLDETLRRTTLASFAARYSDKDIAVDGYNVPAGTPIIQALGVALKNETQWEDVHTHASWHLFNCKVNHNQNWEDNMVMHCTCVQYFLSSSATYILIHYLTTLPIP